MELELDFREDQATWYVGIFFAVLIMAFGLAKIGQPVTPYDGSTARILTWSDWTLLKAEKVYVAELEVLRADVDQLADAIESASNPIQVSLLVDRVLKDTNEGTPTLEVARLAVAQAALDVRSWSTGILDRDSAIASLETAISLLK